MLQEQVNSVQELIRKHLKKMHTAVPGKVVKYYPERGMCDVLPVMQYKKPNGEWIDYPELKDVPVWWPQTFGQESTIVYPIKKDDEVLVLLMERPIDYWLFGQQTEQDLMFDLSEAICIPGLFAKPNKLAKTAQDEEAIIIQRKDTFVKIKEKEIELNSEETVVVNAKKDITVNSDTNIILNADQKIELNGEEILINGSEMNASAEFSLDGDITIAGDVIADGVSLKEHTHNDSEGEETTPPNA